MVRDEFKQHVTAQRVLQNQLASGRLSHAYLFAGPSGVGKLAAARAFAAAINCPQRQKACTCAECVLRPELQHPDLHLVSPDGSSIKLQQVRSLVSQTSLTPNQGRYRIFIIESADCLTREAANALLLTLEEPNASALFILTAASPILPTILSRCQVVQFHRSGQADVTGSALEEETLAVLETVMRTNVLDRARLAEEIAASAEGTRLFLATLLDVLRDLLVWTVGRGGSLAARPTMAERFGPLFPDSTNDLAVRCQLVVDSERMLAANVNRRLLVEQLLFAL